MSYDVLVKGMVPIKTIRSQYPQLEPILKKIPDDAWAAVDDSGKLVIGFVTFTTTAIPIEQLQVFKSEEQSTWSSICMRALLAQSEKIIDEKMNALVKPGEQLIKAIPLKKYG